MTEVNLGPYAQQAYSQLERAGALRLLDAIDDALDILEADPGDKRARRRSFGDGRWGIPVRDADDNWLIIWFMDAEGADIAHVPYIGPDPFA